MPSISRCLHAKISQKVMLLPRGSLPLSKLIWRELSASQGRDRVTPRLLEEEQLKRYFVNFQGRSHSSFHDNHNFRKQYRSHWLNC